VRALIARAQQGSELPHDWEDIVVRTMLMQLHIGRCLPDAVVEAERTTRAVLKADRLAVRGRQRRTTTTAADSAWSS
jgi:hypothetical protein